MTFTMSQTAELLGVASGFDNRKPSDLATRAWMLALNRFPDITYADAVEAVIEHATGPKAHEYLTVGHVVDAVKLMNRQTPAQIAADVRSARARGFVGVDWPESRAVPPEVQQKLYYARQGIRDLAERQELEAATGEPVATGLVLRSDA